MTTLIRKICLFLLFVNINLSIPVWAETLHGYAQDNHVITQTPQISSAPPLPAMEGFANNNQSVVNINDFAAPPQYPRQLVNSFVSPYVMQQSQNIPNQPSPLPLVNHGQYIVGVIGCEVSNFKGIILHVFPPSNLNRWGIHPGDRVLGYNHHPFINGNDMVREACLGPPGSIMEITILHNGQIMSLPVMRVDSRLLVGYDSAIGSRHYEDCAAQTRFW